MCGTLDSNAATDFTGPGGVQYDDAQTAAFIKSWKVSAGETLLYGVAAVSGGAGGAGDEMWCECFANEQPYCKLNNDVETCKLFGNYLGERGWKYAVRVVGTGDDITEP